MALIAMAVYDTEENQRTKYTAETLDCLRRTVNLSRHRVIIANNASCPETVELFRKYPQFEYIHMSENVGTARAINHAWRARRPGEHAVKMDNDVVIHRHDWCDWLENVASKGRAWDIRASNWVQARIGIVGLKRKDCIEAPWRDDGYKSELYRMDHELGERFLDIERVGHVMGTCQLYTSDLLDKIGYLYQPKLYGFDDVLASVRAQQAGFWTVFLPCIEIDHIDPGGTPYQKWKEMHAGEQWGEIGELVRRYKAGLISTYYNPFE